MITTKKQAVAVQERRAKSGKRGFAKAVRRYWLRELQGTRRLHSYADGYAVTWAKPNKATAAP